MDRLGVAGNVSRIGQAYVPGVAGDFSAMDGCGAAQMGAAVMGRVMMPGGCREGGQAQQRTEADGEKEADTHTAGCGGNEKSNIRLTDPKRERK